MLKREDIRIRDPFILTDFDMGCYLSVGISSVISLAMILGLSFLYQKYAEKLCNKLQGKIFNSLK